MAILCEMNRPTSGEASIAVLPFANMSADKENEDFGDGLAEEIINVLAHVPGLKVAGRTSSFFFRGKDVEFERFGRRLNVEHILEGSVRKAGNRIRVTAQLIKVADGFHLWSNCYDREMTDIFAIQNEITHSIAAALRIGLSRETTTVRRHVPNLRADEVYLKARDQLGTNRRRNRWSCSRSASTTPLSSIRNSGWRAASRAVTTRCCRAWASNRHARVIPLAKAAEHEALRIDPSLPEAHALLAVCAGTYDYDWSEAQRHWRLAMAREPVSHDIRLWYGNHYLLPIGRPLEAVEMIAKSLDGDPLNPLGRHHFAVALRHAGRLEDAEVELRKVLEIDENFPPALNTLGAVCAQQGRLEGVCPHVDRTGARRDALGECGHRTTCSAAGSRRIDERRRDIASTARSRRRVRSANRARGVSRVVWGFPSGPSIGQSARSKSDIHRWSLILLRPNFSPNPAPGGPPIETDEAVGMTRRSVRVCSGLGRNLPGGRNSAVLTGEARRSRF